MCSWVIIGVTAAMLHLFRPDCDLGNERMLFPRITDTLRSSNYVMKCLFVQALHYLWYVGDNRVITVPRS